MEEMNYLTKIWCNMCNYYANLAPGCKQCPFKDDPEMCYDSAGESNYDKFESFIRGLKIDGRNEEN